MKRLPEKTPRSFRLSKQAIDYLVALSHHYSISQTAVLETIIRDKAIEKGISFIDKASK